MFIFVSLIHVLMCIILIVIVLLQSGKGSDLASAFGGGGSNTMFGSHGAASFLNKLTTIAAIMFMVTSLTLAILSAGPEDSIMDDLELDPATTETESGTTTPESETSEPSEPMATDGENQTEGAVSPMTERDSAEDAPAVEMTQEESTSPETPASTDMSTNPETDVVETTKEGVE